MNNFNPFHLVDISPWPLFTSFSFLSFGLGVIVIVRSYIVFPFIFSLILLIYSSFLWGQDIHRESCYLGLHNNEVTDGFNIGILFFILSECFFFFGMFWSYAHLAESPDYALGFSWPPVGVLAFDPKGIPFLNTVLLVSSGVSVTWSHHAVEAGNFNQGVVSLFWTITLGMIFTSFQFVEYYVSSFTFACSSYSSIYFLGTGFHGTHVLIGSILLLIALVRFSYIFASPTRIAGFECFVWYWHFVDVVWFFLYLVFYWWGA